MNKDLQTVSKSGKQLRSASEPLLGNIRHDHARERISGTLTIESFWRAIDGDHDGHR